ncbi:hypothetical protein [Arcobacter sp. LA11]|uniref:hypothetical protein n=1 Tax=Arcobacter sp. LA11 TaxID=1898176 RepID=UPI000933BBC0|nr:hypothetical protein [Arcobacter sp. LA11]
MRILLSYPTDAGIFDIGQSVDKKYHPIYNDESLGSYSSVQEAVDSLLNNETASVKHFETKELIDTSKLGIPEDYTQWDSNY